ncbi:hypothetical protein ZIOFF_020312 [Zingiber officinale]|uniref:Uncharacterized protein n=1 Tax=Zingiber officinale TaxID=94328 RepID=A0A8J5H700_ZINOF|nr:hypothetical protein ZIOFF_020312 [Zingiber officinale]
MRSRTESLICYLIISTYRYQRRQHLIDVTEIFNQLNQEKKRRLFKLINLVILLFLSLFWMIYSILEDDE